MPTVDTKQEEILRVWILTRRTRSGKAHSKPMTEITPEEGKEGRPWIMASGPR